MSELETMPRGQRSPESRMLNTGGGGDRMTLMEVWRVLMKQRYVILIVTLLSVAGAAWYAFGTTPIYQSVARIEIEPHASPNVGIEQVVEQDQLGEQQAELDTEIRVLQSDSVIFETAEDMGLVARMRAAAVAAARKRGRPVPVYTAQVDPREHRAIVNSIRKELFVALIPDTNLVEIRYRNTDPALSAQFVNQLVATFSDADLRSKYERTEHVSAWLQRQLDGLKTDASNAQRELANYQKAHNMVGTDQSSNPALQTLQTLSASVTDAETDRIIKEARMRDFNTLKPNMVALLGDNPSLAALRGTLSTLETQRAQLAATYGPKDPKMIEVQSQIDKVRGQIDSQTALARSQVDKEYQGALGVEQALRNRLSAQQDAVYKQDEGVAQYAILSNQAALTRDLYDTLQIKLKEATVMAGLSAANITVVDPALTPYLPVAPRKRLSLVLGLLGGLAGGCIFAFLIESIDDRLQTSDEVENVSMLPSLAAIPHLVTEMEKRGRRDKTKLDYGKVRLAQQLIAVRDSKSNSAEAYRNLRSSLLLSSIDNPPRLLVVTSAFPEEGKTTTAINCAIVLAQRGERVLLLDADLRRGSLGAVFGLADRSFGLSSILAKPDLHREIAAPLPEVPTLHVLPTGPRPPNPAEMLSSTRMEETLRQWAGEYDRIVIDTAPLLAVSDTQAVCVFADTVVLVTRAGMTRRRALTRARDLLLRINAPIAGVVVNDVDVRLENFYTYRYGTYGYGYGARYGSPYPDRSYGFENEDEENN